MSREYILDATTAHEARREISRRWPNDHVTYKGFDKDGEAVLISAVRELGNRAAVATARRNREAPAVTFRAYIERVPAKMSNDITQAYIRVAKINHYLIRIDTSALSLEALEAAGQELITLSNAKNNKDKTLELALDLLEADLTAKRLKGEFDR